MGANTGGAESGPAVGCPTLEVGGSHVTAALVHLDTGEITSRNRYSLDPAADADQLLGAISQAAVGLAAKPGARWSAAVPGPFDYAAGIARYRDVGKFEALNGVAVGAELRRRITPPPGSLRFIGDAMAFALGEAVFGAERGHRTVAGITLGTGVGSGFVRDGEIVVDDPSLPPLGRADLLTINGAPLEDTVSTRAIVADYAARSGSRVDGIAGVVANGRSGDEMASAVLDNAFRALGAALAPSLAGFGVSLMVVGGGITAAWDLVAPALRAGLEEGGATVRMARSNDSEASALLGAAIFGGASVE